MRLSRCLCFAWPLHIGLDEGALGFDGADEDGVVPRQVGLLVLFRGVQLSQVCAVMEGLLVGSATCFGVLEVTGQSLNQFLRAMTLPAMTVQRRRLLVEARCLVRDAHKRAWFVVVLPRGHVGSGVFVGDGATVAVRVHPRESQAAGGAGHSHAAATAELGPALWGALWCQRHGVQMARMTCASLGVSERLPGVQTGPVVAVVLSALHALGLPGREAPVSRGRVRLGARQRQA